MKDCAVTPAALLSAIVTYAARPSDGDPSPNLTQLRGVIQSGRSYTWVDPATGWTALPAYRTARGAARDLAGVRATSDHPEDLAASAAWRVVDLRDCLPLIERGDVPGAVRCGPGAGTGGEAGWPAGWLIPEADDPLRFRLHPDFPAI